VGKREIADFANAAAILKDMSLQIGADPLGALLRLCVEEAKNQGRYRLARFLAEPVEMLEDCAWFRTKMIDPKRGEFTVQVIVSPNEPDADQMVLHPQQINIQLTDGGTGIYELTDYLANDAVRGVAENDCECADPSPGEELVAREGYICQSCGGFIERLRLLNR
jgi:hypothetical protein